jgi:hypothetical protein
MNMKKAIFATIALLACGVAHADFVNGGFETGDFTGWTTVPAASGTLFGVAPYNSLGFEAPPGGGYDFAYFGAVDGLNDTISQTLATNPGQLYLLTYYAGEDYTATGENLTVTWDANTLFNGTVPAVQDPNTGFYVLLPYTFLVTGTGLDTASFGAYDGPAYIGLDNVSLQAVPEPAPFAALGLGAAGILLRRRRRS